MNAITENTETAYAIDTETAYLPEVEMFNEVVIELEFKTGIIVKKDTSQIQRLIKCGMIDYQATKTRMNDASLEYLIDKLTAYLKVEMFNEVVIELEFKTGIIVKGDTSQIQRLIKCGMIDYQATNKRMNDAITEYLNETTPIPIPETTPIPIPAPTPIPIPETTPTPIPIPETTPIPIPETTPIPALTFIPGRAKQLHYELYGTFKVLSNKEKQSLMYERKRYEKQLDRKLDNGEIHYLVSKIRKRNYDHSQHFKEISIPIPETTPTPIPIPGTTPIPGRVKQLYYEKYGTFKILSNEEKQSFMYEWARYVKALAKQNLDTELNDDDIHQLVSRIRKINYDHSKHFKEIYSKK